MNLCWIYFQKITFIFQLDSTKTYFYISSPYQERDGVITTEIFLVENRLIIILKCALLILCWYSQSHYCSPFEREVFKWGKNSVLLFSLYCQQFFALCVERIAQRHFYSLDVTFQMGSGLIRKVLGCVSLAKWVKLRKSPCC